MDIEQAKDLLQRYQSGNTTPAEDELVAGWYQQLINTGQWQWGEGEKEMSEKVLEASIMRQVNSIPGKETIPVFRRYQWWVAASVIFLVGVFGYFQFFHTPDKLVSPAQTAQVSNNVIKAPQSNKARITLANGQQLYLDSAENGALATQGNVQLVKLTGGKIAYQYNTTGKGTQIEYNTLSNPRGSKVIDMTLADGTKVWLNAASSLTYPVSFIRNEREVSVTGEAYFEVSHDASKPFIVHHKNMNVRVLGTHFNVNTFNDDGDGIDSKVTLLEGVVKVDIGKINTFLRPGQQAVVANGINVVDDVNLDLVMAWKNGYFQFENASLQNVLSEVSRWYDVDVVYEGHNQPRYFVGSIQRDLSLPEILKILQKNKVHFKIDGGKLSVKPD